MSDKSKKLFLGAVIVALGLAAALLFRKSPEALPTGPAVWSPDQSQVAPALPIASAEAPPTKQPRLTGQISPLAETAAAANAGQGNAVDSISSPANASQSSAASDPFLARQAASAATGSSTSGTEQIPFLAANRPPVSDGWSEPPEEGVPSRNPELPLPTKSQLRPLEITPPTLSIVAKPDDAKRNVAAEASTALKPAWTPTPPFPAVTSAQRPTVAVPPAAINDPWPQPLPPVPAWRPAGQAQNMIAASLQPDGATVESRYWINPNSAAPTGSVPATATTQVPAAAAPNVNPAVPQGWPNPAQQSAALFNAAHNGAALQNALTSPSGQAFNIVPSTASQSFVAPPTFVPAAAAPNEPAPAPLVGWPPAGIDRSAAQTFPGQVRDGAATTFGWIGETLFGPGAGAAPEGMRTYMVKPLETWETLSKKFYGDTRFAAQLHAANAARLRDPSKLPPGTVLVIPALK